MNLRKRLLSLSIGIISFSTSFARLATVIEHRSQSSNNARKVAGEFGYVHLRDQDSWYARSASTFEYQRSFRSNRLARALFGCYVNDCGEIKIQGSQVEDRSEDALLADYFYLPTDYDSTVTIKPVISDLIFDYDFYIGFNCACLQDCYLRVYAPLVRSKWSMNFKECVNDKGKANHPAGYFTPCEMDRSLLLQNFCEYIEGKHPENICVSVMNPGRNETPNPLDLGDELASTVFNGLNYYRSSCCDSLVATTIADLRTELGWNFINKPHGHWGLNLQAAFPTGTRPSAQYMFNPVVGNGKHWEFGGGTTAHVIFWECGELEKSLSLNLDANFTYMFPNREQRTYDLQAKELSRFMLAAREGANVAVVGALAGSLDNGTTFSTPCGQFKYEYTPVANLTTFDIRVRNSIQLDMALWFNYTNNNLSVDLGYNLWFRACDRIDMVEDCKQCPNLCSPENQDVWVLKGDAQVYGFVDRGLATGCDADFAIALSASQTGTGNGTGATITKGADLDNPQPAWGNLDGNELDRERLYTAPTGGEQVDISVSPIYLQCCDIDFQTRNKALSNKVWTNIQWTWDLDRNCNPLPCMPFLGIGAEVEFGKTDPECKECSLPSTCCVDPCVEQPVCPTFIDCDRDCIKLAVSQWGIWLKGGINFE